MGGICLWILALGVTNLSGCAANNLREEDAFDLCLRGQRGCRMEQLDAFQREEIERRAAAAHLEDCMNRRRCNQSLLSGTEREQVRTSVLTLNYAACMKGEVECEDALLEEAQREEVMEAASRRNLEMCLGGLTLCNAALLTEQQKQAVHEAYLRRNFSGCMNTVGTLVECNEEDLTEDQLAAVHRRNSAVNAYLCATGAFGCDLDRLAAEERARVKSEGRTVR